jgi:hypothetical protein
MTRNYLYTQTVIGDCGHLCDAWPTVAELGGRNPTVICDICTREKYKIPEADGIAVWVRINKDERPPDAPPKRERKPVAKKVKPPQPWEVFLSND